MSKTVFVNGYKRKFKNKLKSTKYFKNILLIMDTLLLVSIALLVIGIALYSFADYKGKSYSTYGLVLAGLAVPLFMYWGYKRNQKPSTVEPYVTANDAMNIGSFSGNYRPLATAHDDHVSEPTNPSYDGAHFADLVSDGNHASEYTVQPKTKKEMENPMERLSRTLEARTPRTSNGVTPYAVDTANPAVHRYTVSAPHVSLKPRNADYSLVSFIRGDVKIKHLPNFARVEKSQYDNTNNPLRAGLFSDSFNERYKRATTSTYPNYKWHASGGGDNGQMGAPVEVVYE
jgi:hypothetical protein